MSLQNGDRVTTRLGQTQQDNKQDWFLCKKCRVVKTSEFGIWSHLLKKHETCVEREEDRKHFKTIKPNLQQSQGQFYCYTCEIHFKGQEELHVHFQTHQSQGEKTSSFNFNGNQIVMSVPPKVSSGGDHRDKGLKGSTSTSITRTFQSSSIGVECADQDQDQPTTSANLHPLCLDNLPTKEVEVQEEAKIISDIDIEEFKVEFSGNYGEVNESPENVDSHLTGSSTAELMHQDNPQRKPVGSVFYCDKCPEQFNQACSLRCHEKGHGTNFQCLQCYGWFETKYGLRGHRDRFHRKRLSPYHVRLKNKGITSHPTRSSLLSKLAKLSMKKKKKRVKCSVCRKSFKELGKLKEHSWRHTGIKAFSCSICNNDQATFASRSSLRRHLQIVHSTGTTFAPHQCAKCPETFPNSWNLKCHEESHGNEHSCDICAAGFSLKRNLQSHRLRFHHIKDGEPIIDDALNLTENGGVEAAEPSSMEIYGVLKMEQPLHFENDHDTEQSGVGLGDDNHHGATNIPADGTSLSICGKLEISYEESLFLL